MSVDNSNNNFYMYIEVALNNETTNLWNLKNMSESSWEKPNTITTECVVFVTKTIPKTALVNGDILTCKQKNVSILLYHSGNSDSKPIFTCKS